MFQCRECLGKLVSAFGAGMVIAAFFQSVFVPLLLGIVLIAVGLYVAK